MKLLEITIHARVNQRHLNWFGSNDQNDNQELNLRYLKNS